jgi:hypothetical protein
MRTLRFIVEDQTIKPDPNCKDFDGLVPGSCEVKLIFSFSREWTGHARAVAFYSPLGKEYEARLLEDHISCMVPSEALSKRIFKIRVFGRQWDSILKTNKLAVCQNGGAT